MREKYRDVANDPYGTHHFHTGRPLASRLGYDDTIVPADRNVVWVSVPVSLLEKLYGGVDE